MKRKMFALFVEKTIRMFENISSLMNTGNTFLVIILFEIIFGSKLTIIVFIIAEVMRDHQSHDVLLMCSSCHRQSNLHDMDLRRQLAEECNAPIGSDRDIKFREDPEVSKNFLFQEI